MACGLHPMEPNGGYFFSDLLADWPKWVVAVPTGCLAYCTLRTGFGVAFRLREPAVLRTGCKARLAGFGNNPRRKLIEAPFSPRRTA
jgi:hypothetical protein